MKTVTEIHRAAVLACGLLLTACPGDSAVPRQAPFPDLEPTAPFPSLASRGPGTTEPGEPETDTELTFEERLTRRAPPTPAEPATTVSNGLPLPLTDRLIGEVGVGASWRWSAAGDSMLAIHQESGHPPDALIYAHSLSTDMGRFPGRGTRRFHDSLHPLDGRSFPDLTVLLSLFGRDSPGSGCRASLTAIELARATALLESRTLGLGLGFRASGDGFTGYRWVGENEHGVAIRLGRYSGLWGTPEPLPRAVREALECVAGEHETPTGPARAAISAHLLVGTATDRDSESGAHLAILWSSAAGSSLEPDLARFLASLRFEQDDPQRLSRLRKGAPIAFRDLSSSAGLVLRPEAPTEPRVGRDQLDAEPALETAGPERIRAGNA